MGRNDRIYRENNLKKRILNLEKLGIFSYYCTMSYIIIKMVKNLVRSTELPVIILDGEGEVLEFDTIEQAEDMRSRFEINSDSGYKYRIKKIGEHHDTIT